MKDEFPFANYYEPVEGFPKRPVDLDLWMKKATALPPQEVGAKTTGAVTVLREIRKQLSIVALAAKMDNVSRPQILAATREAIKLIDDFLGEDDGT